MAAGQAVDYSNINNLKDILSTYNRITESCFSRCAYNFNQRQLTDNENDCVMSCASKFINTNQRMMMTFMDIQMKKNEAQAEEQLKAQQLAQTQAQDSAAVQPTTQIPAAEMAAAAFANIEAAKSADDSSSVTGIGVESAAS
ncbi:hypothetical protein CAPTEDRAFT_173021 [Capitella teleta]|uniref:Mitochondrial import inner membrane translocase subunit n=1 Tax=Capitella teleta TaxID=283909 RepID=R7V5B7_CAPTE|nr:hypothetical protein CAPTEDRAFT_173021 [Capitella teleta]|eukprot:ELU14058.1 hypothetical protein CAPTEDRAFT_173021 [Capitella teleta]